jgi:hypothetical protein
MTFASLGPRVVPAWGWRQPFKVKLYSFFEKVSPHLKIRIKGII